MASVMARASASASFYPQQFPPREKVWSFIRFPQKQVNKKKKRMAVSMVTVLVLYAYMQKKKKKTQEIEMLMLTGAMDLSLH